MESKFNRRVSLLVIVAMIITGSAVSSFAANDYSNHWAAGSIEHMVNKGIVKGYPDGSFKPDNPITRAEFVSVIDTLLDYQESGPITFKDVSMNAWYHSAVIEAATAGIVQGSNGLFRPNEKISRQEAAVILFNAYKLAGMSSSANRFSDGQQIAAWASNQVGVLAELGFINGRSNNEFAPTAALTRAEAIKLIDNISTSMGTAFDSNPLYDGVIPNQDNGGTINDIPAKTEISVYAKDLKPLIVNVGTGVYNLAFSKSTIVTKFPTIKTTDNLNLFIKGSAEINYKVVYIENIPVISGQGWLAFNIQGVSEQQMLEGIISFED